MEEEEHGATVRVEGGAVQDDSVHLSRPLTPPEYDLSFHVLLTLRLQRRWISKSFQSSILHSIAPPFFRTALPISAVPASKAFV